MNHYTPSISHSPKAKKCLQAMRNMVFLWCGAITSLQANHNESSKMIFTSFWAPEIWILKSSIQESIDGIILKMSYTLENPPDNTNQIKQVSIDEFEKHLFTLDGQTYEWWKTDCSGIFFMIFQKLNILKDFELTFENEGSTTIIKKLTQNQKELDEIERWDLIYWESSRYPGAKHIAYISKVEKNGAWIFDSSVDTGKAKKRFLDWKTLERKKGFIAGTPVFLAEI